MPIQTSTANGTASKALIISSATRRRIKDAALPEYDPLADLYDLEYSHDYDLPFWLSLADRQGGPIIEWGAGTGRLAVPLAEAGYDVTAVELSGRMVERGREKSEVVEWVHGDMRRAELGRRYGLAICAFNSFLCLLSVDDALAFLRNAREHLEPGGTARDRGLRFLASKSSWTLPAGRGCARLHPRAAARPARPLLRLPLRRSLTATGDAAVLRAVRRVGRAGGEAGARPDDQSHVRDELGLVLRLAGFEVEAVYGGFEGEAFTAESDHLIVLARRD